MVQSGIDAEQLRFFLPDAVELARQGESALYSLPAQQLQSMRTAFSLARRVKVVFDEEVARLHPARHVTLLEALAKAFDKASTADVSRCTVVIGEGSGVDGLGRLWLRYDEGPDQWCRTLQGADMELMHQRRIHVQQVHQAEVAVAKVLGVRCIFSTPRFALSGAYMEFLQRLVATAESIGPISAGSVGGINICVLPVTELRNMEHTTAMGVIKVNTDVHVLDLYDYVSAHAPAMLGKLRRDSALEGELDKLGREVERQLMLRRLSRDISLPPEDFKSGCYRLLRHRGALIHHTEGARIRLTHQNGIKSGDTVVDIAWNFEL